MAEQRFTLHYQPQYAMDRHEIIAVEALVRLRTREGDLIPPDDFIGIAEGNGFIVQLGYWVIREACRQLADWRRTGCNLGHIAVNVSRRQLLDQRLADVIEQAITDNGLAFRDLELEITESCILEELPASGGLLATLQQKGVRIAMDDFGAGHSNFAALTQLPIDTFKLDRSLLASVAQDTRAAQVVTAIMAMANQLGYRVVAEGVETSQQHHFVQSSGCHLAQGFGLARPEPAEAIGRLLQAAHTGAQAG
jgi:EAL domain-containing protein (putative c-di-GMP-specific phosphodiesterase class I)